MGRYGFRAFFEAFSSSLERPIFRFAFECIMSGLAQVFIYLVMRTLAYFTEYLDFLLPIENKAPMILLRDGLTWAGALVALLGFIVSSIYQLRNLRHELKESKINKEENAN